MERERQWADREAKDFREIRETGETQEARNTRSEIRVKARVRDRGRERERERESDSAIKREGRERERERERDSAIKREGRERERERERERDSCREIERAREREREREIERDPSRETTGQTPDHTANNCKETLANNHQIPSKHSLLSLDFQSATIPPDRVRNSTPPNKRQCKYRQRCCQISTAPFPQRMRSSPPPTCLLAELPYIEAS